MLLTRKSINPFPDPLYYPKVPWRFFTLKNVSISSKIYFKFSKKALEKLLSTLLARHWRAYTEGQ